MAIVWTEHPVIAAPTVAQIQALAARSGIPADRAAAEVWRRREATIKQEKAFPLESGYEPPMWKLADALLGFDWVDDEWAERMRLACGFRKPVSVLLILGGWRGGKSQYAARTCMKIMLKKAGARAWMLHTNRRMSVEYQQPLVHYFLPQHLKGKDLRTRTTYIKYSVKNGFSDGRLVLPNLSDLSFLAYEMERATVEGGNVDYINPDELVPSDWVETMQGRIAERHGKMVVTFTPVRGYSDTVRMFLDGAKITRESVGFMFPKDGGNPDVARALGLTDAEYQHLTLRLEHQKRTGPVSVWSRPEEVGEWVVEKKNGTDGKKETNEWGRGTGRSQPGVPAGREFMKVPRVAKPRDSEEERAVIWFHSADNPYGNPLSVWRTLGAGDQDFKRMRFYGWARKTITGRFSRFDMKAHVVAAAAVPDAGTNYHIVDPCSGRNFFMLWIRATPEGAFVYREWPSARDRVPGEGVLGDWAVPDAKRLDGKQGPAQKSLGWGYCQYKREIARLEGWKVAEEEVGCRRSEVGGQEDRTDGHGQTQTDDEIVAGWDQYGEARERIQARFMDARFGNVKSFEEGGQVTLLDDFDEKAGLTFYPTTAAGEGREGIDTGVTAINAALFYDEKKPIDFFNKPHLFVSDACENLIFALQNWTGEDGGKGACKDPVDCLRYFYLAHCEYVGEQRSENRGRRSGGGVY